MTGNTHIAVGISSSLAILQPDTVPECLCAITGGMIGGMISDIDSPRKRDSLNFEKDRFGWQAYTFLCIALVFLLGMDYEAGNGAVDYIIKNFGPSVIVGGTAFLGLCFYGAHTYHRSFTHSIVAGILFSLSLWCFCKPLAIPFSLGFASHLILDFFNKKKVQYLWPLPVKLGLNKFPADGRLNEALGGIGTTLSIYLSCYFFITSFSESVLFNRIMNGFSTQISLCGVSVPFIVLYLFVINVFGFLVYILDYIFCKWHLFFYYGTKEHSDNMQEFLHTLLLGIDISGGMVGKLLAVILVTKGKIWKKEGYENFNLFIIPICIFVIWMAFLCTFFPEKIIWFRSLSKINIGKFPMSYLVIGYFIIMNIITAILFPKMQRFAAAITSREKLCMGLSLLGGATGGYLSMKITGNHSNAIMLIRTLPEMIAMHAVVLTCAFL